MSYEFYFLNYKYYGCPPNSRYFKEVSVLKKYIRFQKSGQKHVAWFSITCTHSLFHSRLPLIYLNLQVWSNPFRPARYFEALNLHSWVSTLQGYAALATLAGNDKDLDFTSQYTVIIPQQKVQVREIATAGNHIKEKINIALPRASIDRIQEKQRAYLSIRTCMCDLVSSKPVYYPSCGRNSSICTSRSFHTVTPNNVKLLTTCNMELWSVPWAFSLHQNRADP